MEALEAVRDNSVSSNDWDYRTANTKLITHGIHAYPATMVPQVARRLIESYGREANLIFDPYCGSGTTLLEGMLAKLVAVGTDLNPLARLIARVKTTKVEIGQLDRETERFCDNPPASDPPIPNVPNIDYWFAAEQQHALAKIKAYIDGIENKVLADVFRVAFSLTVREVSWIRKHEFKLRRILESRIVHHKPNAHQIMQKTLRNLRNALAELTRIANGCLCPKVHDFNTVVEVPRNLVAPATVDLVVTSPPYGDSRTTVAYGQFSRLSAQWLELSNANRIDNLLMGGRRAERVEEFGCDVLDRTIKEISKVDSNRSLEVVSFFEDYRSSIKNVSRLVRAGGHICYVVGNRTVKGLEIPTAEATIEFFTENGFKTVYRISRNIPSKRMPALNSPSNVVGKVGRTMTTENIVICKKVN